MNRVPAGALVAPAQPGVRPRWATVSALRCGRPAVTLHGTKAGAAQAAARYGGTVHAWTGGMVAREEGA